MRFTSPGNASALPEASGRQATSAGEAGEGEAGSRFSCSEKASAGDPAGYPAACPARTRGSTRGPQRPVRPQSAPSETAGTGGPPRSSASRKRRPHGCRAAEGDLASPPGSSEETTGSRTPATPLPGARPCATALPPTRNQGEKGTRSGLGKLRANSTSWSQRVSTKDSCHYRIEPLTDV